MVDIDSLVDFVWNWLDLWETRELERMFAKHSPSVEGIVKLPKAERRVALEKRRRVAEMSPKEMVLELLISDVTGLPNRRAFDEAEVAPAVAMSDVDGLKALNDKYAYAVGNALLKAKAEALRSAGLEAYHDKGDEFLFRGNSIAELQADLEHARAILRDRIIVVERTNGSTLRFTGADFSYGVGKDMGEAESRLKHHKAERKDRGEVARGELRGIEEEQGKNPSPELGTPQTTPSAISLEPLPPTN
jgi:GGDEF domain-containing protein